MSNRATKRGTRRVTSASVRKSRAVASVGGQKNGSCSRIPLPGVGTSSAGSGTDLSTCSESPGLTQEQLAGQRPLGGQGRRAGAPLLTTSCLPLPAQATKKDKHWTKSQERNSQRGRTIGRLEHSSMVRLPKFES